MQCTGFHHRGKSSYVGLQYLCLDKYEAILSYCQSPALYLSSVKLPQVLGFLKSYISVHGD